MPYVLFSGKAHKHKSHINVSAKAGKSAGGQQSVDAVSTTSGDASTVNSADSSVASIASGKAGKSSRRLLDIGSEDLDCESMSFVLVSEVSAKSAKPRVVSAKSLKADSTVSAKSAKKTITEGASQEEVEMSNDEGKVSLDVASKSSKATPALRFIEPQKAQSYIDYTRAKAPVAGVKDESSSAVSVESLLAFAVPIIGAMFV